MDGQRAGAKPPADYLHATNLHDGAVQEPVLRLNAQVMKQDSGQA